MPVGETLLERSLVGELAVGEVGWDMLSEVRLDAQGAVGMPTSDLYQERCLGIAKRLPEMQFKTAGALVWMFVALGLESLKAGDARYRPAQSSSRFNGAS